MAVQVGRSNRYQKISSSRNPQNNTFSIFLSVSLCPCPFFCFLQVSTKIRAETKSSQNRHCGRGYRTILCPLQTLCSDVCPDHRRDTKITHQRVSAHTREALMLCACVFNVWKCTWSRCLKDCSSLLQGCTYEKSDLQKVTARWLRPQVINHALVHADARK